MEVVGLLLSVVQSVFNDVCCLNVQWFPLSGTVAVVTNREIVVAITG